MVLRIGATVTCNTCGVQISKKASYSHYGSSQCEVNVEVGYMARRNLYPVLRRHEKMLRQNNITLEMHVGACRGEEKFFVPFVERPVEFLCMNLKNKALKWAIKKYATDETFRATFSSALELGDDGLGAQDVLNYVLDQYAEEHSVKIPKLDQELEVLRESLAERMGEIDVELASERDIGISPVISDSGVGALENAARLGRWAVLKGYLRTCHKSEILHLREYRVLEDICNTMLAHQRRYFEAGLLR